MYINKLELRQFIKDGRPFSYSVITAHQASIHPHDHDFYELFIITEGQVVHMVNDQEQPLKVGSMVFVRPEDVHFYKNVSINYSFINLAFGTKLFNDLLVYLDSEFLMQNLFTDTISPATILTPLQINYVLARFEKINTIEIPQNQGLAFRILLGELMILFQSNNGLIENSPVWLRECCIEMQNAANFQIGLSRFYELSQKTSEHLTRMMKKHLNLTPTQFINSLRINYAQNLLATTNLSVMDICYKAGYDSLSHFNHLFKAKNYISPTKYREANRSKLA